MKLSGNLTIDNLQQRATYLTDIGVVDAYSVRFTYPISPGYTNGLQVVFQAGTTNTGPCTLEVDGYGPRPIMKNVSTPLVAGDLPVGKIVSVIYDGGNFQLMDSAASAPVTQERFGFPAEDVQALEDRTFDLNNHNFNIFDLGDPLEFRLGFSLAQAAIGATRVISGPNLAFAELDFNTIGSNARFTLFSQVPGGGLVEVSGFGETETLKLAAANGITLDGPLIASDYGTGAITGTPTYALNVDAGGNVIEVPNIEGFSGVRFDDTTGRLGLGRLQTDTGNTQATLVGDSEVLLDGRQLRFIDTSTSGITRQNTQNMTGAFNTSNVLNWSEIKFVDIQKTVQWAIGDYEEYKMQSGFVLRPFQALHVSRSYLNGNVTTDGNENSTAMHMWRAGFEATTGYPGGLIAVGARGHSVGRFETDFEANFNGSTTGSMRNISSRLKLSGSVTVAMDSFTHIMVNDDVSFGASSTLGTHTGIQINALKNAFTTNAYAIDQQGTSDLVNIAGIFRLIPRTATSASAITPLEGDIVFVSNTDGTFTSIGPWCYYNGAWHAL
jgi:hypothetical protein